MEQVRDRQLALEYGIVPQATIDTVTDKNGNNMLDASRPPEIDEFFDDTFLEFYIRPKQKCADIAKIEGTLSIELPQKVHQITLDLAEGEQRFDSEDGAVTVAYEKARSPGTSNAAAQGVSHEIKHTFEDHPMVKFYDADGNVMQSRGSSRGVFGSNKFVTQSLSGTPQKVIIFSVVEHQESQSFPLSIKVQ